MLPSVADGATVAAERGVFLRPGETYLLNARLHVEEPMRGQRSRQDRATRQPARIHTLADFGFGSALSPTATLTDAACFATLADEGQLRTCD